MNAGGCGKMSKDFVIGTRVYFDDGERTGWGCIRGKEGRDALAIEVDGWTERRMGHDCDGLVPRGGGWWVEAHNIALVSEPGADTSLDWGGWEDE